MCIKFQRSLKLRNWNNIICKGDIIKEEGLSLWNKTCEKCHNSVDFSYLIVMSGCRDTTFIFSSESDSSCSYFYSLVVEMCPKVFKLIYPSFFSEIDQFLLKRRNLFHLLFDILVGHKIERRGHKILEISFNSWLTSL